MSKSYPVIFLAAIAVFFLAGKLPKVSIDSPKEKHLKNLRQLTFGGDNAEAYFSPDGKSLTFQSNYKKWNLYCDQIFMMKIADARDSNYLPQHIITDDVRTTFSYFMPDRKHILYAST